MNKYIVIEIFQKNNFFNGRRFLSTFLLFLYIFLIYNYFVEKN